MHYYLYLSPLESSTGDKKYVGNDLWGMHKPKTLRVRENGNGARDSKSLGRLTWPSTWLLRREYRRN